MAFELKLEESVADGIRRNVSREIEKALDGVGGRGKPPPRGKAEVLAVHDVRKCFKKVRAALRLVREELGDDVYRAENFCFRDAARPLTEVRDAQMLVETLDKLEAPPIALIRDALLANEQDITRRVLHEEHAFAAVREFGAAALARIPTWRIERDGFAAVESGLRRVYRTGHRALALAAENPTIENLHEWRKQAKYLWHVLQLVEPTKELANQAHELSRVLGDDHDLAVLRRTLAADPLTYGGHPTLKALFAFIDRRREELQRNASALGRQLYADPPKLFPSRLETYWTRQPVNAA